VLIFFFSGMASLIYQVAWQRLLTVYLGVGALSITLIVSVYMLGLGWARSAEAGGQIALILFPPMPQWKGPWGCSAWPAFR